MQAPYRQPQAPGPPRSTVRTPAGYWFLLLLGVACVVAYLALRPTSADHLTTRQALEKVRAIDLSPCAAADGPSGPIRVAFTMEGTDGAVANVRLAEDRPKFNARYAGTSVGACALKLLSGVRLGELDMSSAQETNLLVPPATGRGFNEREAIDVLRGVDLRVCAIARVDTELRFDADGSVEAHIAYIQVGGTTEQIDAARACVLRTYGAARVKPFAGSSVYTTWTWPGAG